VVGLDTSWVWSIDNTNFLVLGDLLNGRLRVNGVLDNWRVLDDNWLLGDESWLLEFATALVLLPLFPSALLLSTDLFLSDLSILEAFDVVEVTAEEGDSEDNAENMHKASKSSEFSMASMTSMLSVLSVVTLRWSSLRSDSWTHWWSSVEGLFFIFHHWWWSHHWWWWWSLTSLMSSTVVWSTLMVSSTLVWSTLMVSSASSTMHVIDELSPEGFWLFLFLLFEFLLNLIMLEGAWKWIASEDSCWEFSSI